ncbi:MAG: glycosyltransferase family 39 protein, partial [Bdellovibrionales bacterium]|nr:glycosyltransferase family 39 protein [Bdellovibrionales bacterium]
PLHFWLTALSYSAFGVDEWTSRLPSFLSLLMVVGSLLLFAKRFLTMKIGYLSALICVTSPLMFFLGGSSTVDVTFAACTTAALVSYAFFAFSSGAKTLKGILVFLFSALGFLTKGPAAMVIIGFPIVLTAVFKRDYLPLRSLPWFLGGVVFLGLVCPWFYLLERATPGSTWYFFYVENFLRFTTADYGGRFGDAHIRPYGSILWMVALGMLPWLLFSLVDAKFIKHQFARLCQEPMGVFLLATACGPLLFFTFAKSILPAYSTPAIPGVALILAYFLLNPKLGKSHNRGAFKRRDHTTGVASLGVGATFVMVVGLFVMAPQIEIERSAAELLEVLADETKGGHPVVATLSERDLSPYWLEGAYENELSKPIHIVHADGDDIAMSKFRHVIVRDKRVDEQLFSVLKENYEKRLTLGRWHWYIRRKNVADERLALNERDGVPARQ